VAGRRHTAVSAGNLSRAEQTFRISLGTNARAQNGLALASQPALTFQSPGELELVEFQPANNARDVNSSGGGRRVQPTCRSAFGRRPGRAACFFHPARHCRAGRMDQHQHLCLLPRSGPTRRCRLHGYGQPGPDRYQGAALDPALQQPFSWRFRTVSPRLDSFNPPENTELGLEDSFELVFNQPMDTASVEELFSLMDARGNTVNGTFEWSQQNRRFVFTPDAPLARASVYTLQLPADTQALGGATLGTAYIRPLHHLPSTGGNGYEPQSG
jgi:hypothetical protein